MYIDDLPPTVSVEKAGKILGISRRSAYRAASTGELPTLRIGRRLLVPTPRLLALLGATPPGGQSPDDGGRLVRAPEATEGG